MSLPLTPERIAAAYDYLRITPPFSAWKLPPAEEVEFHVTRHRDREGDHRAERRAHVIRVSAYRIKATDPLMMVLAHEMVHAYQDGIARTGSRKVDHNAEFKRLAARVCRIHGWDTEAF